MSPFDDSPDTLPERKPLEVAPRPAKARRATLGAYFDAAPVALVAIDQSLSIVACNQAACSLFGRSSETVQQQSLTELVGARSPLLALVRRSVEDLCEIAERDLDLLGVHGPVGTCDVRVAPMEDDGVVVMSLHPQEQRDRADMLWKARGASVPMTAFARALAHEVRNPLAGIRGAAQLLRKGLSEEDAGLAQLICDETDRVARLASRLEMLEALAPPNLRDMNIHEPLGRVRDLLRVAFPTIEIVEMFDPSLPHVMADMDQLVQAFLNIAKNGAEAAGAHAVSQAVGASGPQSQRGAKARVTLQTRYRPGIKIKTGPGTRARARLEVAIIDNGPGIPEAIRRRLFEPFVTGRAQGVGLGLAIAAEIIARNEGVIEVDSHPGQTAFRILLPIGPHGLHS